MREPTNVMKPNISMQIPKYLHEDKELKLYTRIYRNNYIIKNFFRAITLNYENVEMLFSQDLNNKMLADVMPPINVIRYVNRIFKKSRQN